MSKYLSFFILLVVIISSLLVWVGSLRINDFKEYHNILSASSTSNLAHEINNFIKERQRFVLLFANEHVELIEQMINQPDNDQIKENIKQQLKQYFPKYFTFTIANNKGKPLLDDFDGFIGDLCVNDIETFASTGINNPRIHPGVSAYHFDIMAPLNIRNKKLILFVSFQGDILGRIINNIQVPGHNLAMVIKSEAVVLEATSVGARNKTIRNDYRLSEDELGNILNEKQIKETKWYAIDSIKPEVIDKFVTATIIQGLVLLSVSLLVISLFIIRLRNEENRRLLAEKAKDDFLSIVSHELRTPLTSIHGALSLLAGGTLKDNPDQTQSMLDIANRNSSQLLFLINELLDFRKIESGKLEYNFEKVELNSLITETIEGLSDYAQQYNATFLYSKSADPVYVYIDHGRIKQVLNNLLSNAVKYGSENDNINIDVELIDNKVRVSITDHGEGVPEEFIPRIFEKFSQANVTNKQTTGGTGLGLNITKTFIEAHHGTIDFQTQQGKGSTFYFELPVISNEQE